MDLQKQIKDLFLASQQALITSHIRADGDAVGSSLALALGLKDIGKNVQVVLADGLPKIFRNLPGADLVTEKAEGEFDLVVCLDCSEMKRTGSALKGFGRPDIVIDHHLTHSEFGRVNLIDPQAAATASLLVRHMQDWGMTISPDIATNLMTGLVTDTIGFRTTSTTPEILKQAAALLEMGVDLTAIYFDNLIRRTYEEVRYWGAGLVDIQHKKGIVWTTLSLADRKEAGYKNNDDADLINILTSVDNADMAIVFVEQGGNMVKVSWRAISRNLDVSKVAANFNGGGHLAAAGAEISGTLDEVCKKVLATSHAALQQSAHKR